MHVELKACHLCHENIAALKTSVDMHWAAMSEDYIRATCQAFRRHIKAIMANGGIH